MGKVNKLSEAAKSLMNYEDHISDVPLSVSRAPQPAPKTVAPKEPCKHEPTYQQRENRQYILSQMHTLESEDFKKWCKDHPTINRPERKTVFEEDAFNAAMKRWEEALETNKDELKRFFITDKKGQVIMDASGKLLPKEDVDWNHADAVLEKFNRHFTTRPNKERFTQVEDAFECTDTEAMVNIILSEKKRVEDLKAEYEASIDTEAEALFKTIDDTLTADGNWRLAALVGATPKLFDGYTIIEPNADLLNIFFKDNRRAKSYIPQYLRAKVKGEPLDDLKAEIRRHSGSKDKRDALDEAIHTYTDELLAADSIVKIILKEYFADVNRLAEEKRKADDLVNKITSIVVGRESDLGVSNA